METKKLIAIALICIGVAAYVQRNGIQASQGHGNDFPHLYIGALAMERGINPYNSVEIRRLATLQGIQRMNPYVYPPFTAILFRPFARMGYREAKLLWFLINQVMIIASFVLLILLWKPQDRLSACALLVVLFAVFSPLTRTLTAGQLNVLLLFLLALAAYLERGPLSAISGALIGVATMVKVFPALFFLYFVGRGNWTAATAMILTIVLLAGFSVSVAGMKTNLDYLDVMSQMRYGSSTWKQYGENYQVEPANLSPSSLFYRLFTTGRGTEGIANAPGIAKMLSWIAGLSVLVALLVYLVMARNVSMEKGFSLTLLSALLIPSLMWDHYLVLALLPIVFLASRLESRGGLITVSVWAAAVGMIAMPFNYWSPLFKSGMGILGGSFALFPVLALFLLTWLIPSEQPEKEPAEKETKKKKPREEESEGDNEPTFI